MGAKQLQILIRSQDRHRRQVVVAGVNVCSWGLSEWKQTELMKGILRMWVCDQVQCLCVTWGIALEQLLQV